jgi:23S rRNA A2030 N6-methylase RlmJ
MPSNGRRRFGAIEFERHDNHEKTIQLYPGTVRVREAFVLRSIQQFDFEKIYSCEIIEEYVASSRKRFTDDNRVQIFKGQSFEVIHKTTSLNYF